MSDPQLVEIDEEAQLPDVLPVLPLKDTVVYPDIMVPLTIGQERSLKLMDDVMAGDRLLAFVASKDEEVELPGPADLYTVGTVGLAHKMVKLPDGTMRVLIQGVRRVRLDRFVQEEPYLVAAITELKEVPSVGKEAEALRSSLLNLFSKIVTLVPYLPEELQGAAANIEEPGALAFFIVGTMRLKVEDKQPLLEEDDVEKRIRMLISILTRELDVLELGSKIQSDIRSEIDKGQREYFLRAAAARHPGGARRDRSGQEREDQRTARQASTSSTCPRRSAQGGSPRAANGCDASRRERRVPGDSHLSRLDHHAALVGEQRGQPRHRTRACRFSTATTTTSTRSRTASSSSSPCASSRPTCTGRSSASSARRASARRQLGPLDRRRDRPQVRAHQRRWRARRGRGARASPHVRRGDAGLHHPGHARRRHRQPAVHDRRDRQDRRRTGAVIRQRAARGARSGAEHDRSAITTSTCRSTSAR